MTGAKIDKLVRMANQIGDFFAPLPREKAAEAVANHLKRYWTPKMIGEIIDHFESDRSGVNATAGYGIEQLQQTKSGAP